MSLTSDMLNIYRADDVILGWTESAEMENYYNPSWILFHP